MSAKSAEPSSTKDAAVFLDGCVQTSGAKCAELPSAKDAAVLLMDGFVAAETEL